MGGLMLLALMATGASAQRARRCTGEIPKVMEDSVARVHRDCDVDRSARIDGARPAFQVDATGIAPGCYVAEIELIVDASGAVEPRSLRTVRSTLRSLEEAALARLPSVPWKPALRDGRPVRQLVRYRATFEHTTFEVLRGVSGVATVQSRGRDCR